jgi:hypothetical protein
MRVGFLLSLSISEVQQYTLPLIERAHAIDS